MRSGLLVMLVAGAAFAAGWFGQEVWQQRQGGDETAATMAAGERKPLYWVAPMDPNYKRDKPGKSPMGMDLVPVYEEDLQGQSDDGGVTVSPVVEHNLGVRVAEVTQGPLQLPISTVGVVAFDEDRLVHIHSRVEGWIEALYVKSAGEPVRKGQKLFELYAPALVNAQEEYLAALRSGNRPLLQASQERLLSLGLNGAQIDRLRRQRRVEQRISVYAEQDGVVDQLKVRQGMFIKPALELMSIGALDTVWVIAEVFERQAGWVQQGQRVEMTVPALRGRSWQGQVDYLYPVLDAQTRTLRVRVRIDNADLALKPNMFADLTLYAEVGDAVLSIPREAVIRTGRHDRVVKAEGDGRYRPAFVKLGVEAGDRVQILEGLAAGDRVVTSAQFLIDSESKIDVALAKLEEAQRQAEVAQRVWATGTVNSLMAAHGMLNISHEPVAAWQWPAMKMDFTVAEGVDLRSLSPGQSIRFEISKQDDFDYVVTAIETVAGTTLEHGQGDNADQRTVQATGKIKELMLEAEMLGVVHDPITEWGWPAMNMMFMLAPGEDASGLQAGQRVRFELTELASGDYQIGKITMIRQ